MWRQDTCIPEPGNIRFSSRMEWPIGNLHSHLKQLHEPIISWVWKQRSRISATWGDWNRRTRISIPQDPNNGMKSSNPADYPLTSITFCDMQCPQKKIKDKKKRQEKDIDPERWKSEGKSYGRKAQCEVSQTPRQGTDRGTTNTGVEQKVNWGLGLPSI